ncbi:MAG TPA: GNAT family N-acetyltransferase [Gemmatimonadaceae bacterium]|nr:GNAT family N-acetyltransferase [Gemmatimonadaceae bacterium]
MPAARNFPRLQRAAETDIPALVTLNNMFAPEGKTLPRDENFAFNHLHDYWVLRGERGALLGAVALDEYSPSLVELVALAVDPSARGKGYGKKLIEAACDLARRRGYREIFAVSYADALFLDAGFERAELGAYPEKVARYERIDRSELAVGEKHCFTRQLAGHS